MKPFRATYTPKKWIMKGRSGEYVPDESQARIVLVLTLSEDSESFHAFFIDTDNSLKADSLDRFTDCQSSEWRE